MVHEKENITPLSDHSKEFQHAGRCEGTPRTHLLTVEPLQVDLWGKEGKNSKQSHKYTVN